MRKSNIDNLWSLGFMRICMANFLFFASLYMLFPVLPAVMVSRLGISTVQVGSMFLVFAVGMFLVGPFHAYLGDAYKRKHVLVYSTFIMLAATVGYLFADTLTKLLLLAVVQGGAFGLAATAGITVAIDITNSPHRSAGNMTYALAARLGMLVGVGVGIWMLQLKGFSMVVYLSALCGIFSILFALRVYVAFRAPIGIGRFNIDRFFTVTGLVACSQCSADSFCVGDSNTYNKGWGLQCDFLPGCFGDTYSTSYEDIRQAFAALPAWNSKYNLPFGYGNGNFNRYCSLLLPVKQHRTVFYV